MIARFGYMCYKEHMNTTIRNLDPEAYRALKARAALTGRTIGELINEAIAVYLGSRSTDVKTGSLSDLKTATYASGSEGLSEQIDSIVYGAPNPP
jgi:hypothetical protein